MAQFITMSTPVAQATQRALPLSNSSRPRPVARHQRQRAKGAAEPHGDQRVLARLFHKHADGAQQHAAGNEQPLAVTLALVGWQWGGGKGWRCGSAGWGVVHAANAPVFWSRCKTDKSNRYHSINEFKANRP
jgi:hypothetical protein